MQPVIIVHQLGKQFRRYHRDRPLTIMEAALSGLQRMKPQGQFWALRDISFTVAEGQMLGIIGKNGAGKSTLLQLIGKVGRADEGKVRVQGRIGALLDLGSGFHPDLTGRENVFINGVVAGLTRREVARCFDEIVEFAELESFIDTPLRTYSTGMQMRLGFAIAIHTNPQVLLVDEFLSVGDLAFQSKCLHRIDQLKQQGCAIVLISHEVKQVQQLCDQALWLRQGRIAALGEPESVIKQYVDEMHIETQRRTPSRPPQMLETGLELRLNENRLGSLEVEITNVKVLPDCEIDSGSPLCLEMDFRAEQPVSSPVFSVAIHHEDGQLCFDTNTAVHSLPIPLIHGKGRIKLRIDRLDLNTGKYYISVGVHEQNWLYTYDQHWQTYPFVVHTSPQQSGLLYTPHRWDFIHKYEAVRNAFNSVDH